MSQTDASPLHRRFLRRWAAPLAVTAGVALFVIAFVVADTDDDDGVRIASPAVEELIPPPGSEVLRQSQVGVDLIAGYEAELTVNGVPIPPDQVNVLRDPADPEESADQPGVFGITINRFLYQPLEGRAVPELKGDENCVVARFWPLSDPSDVDSVEWCFTVA